MLQFVEQVFMKNKSELAEIPVFHQSLVLLMFLIEQLGLISMDLPDRINLNFLKGNVWKELEDLSGVD